MHDRVKLAIFLLQFGKQGVDLLITRDVAHERLGARKRSDQVVSLLFQTLILISNGELRPCRLQPLRDRPGDAALIRNSEYNRCLAVHRLRHLHPSFELERITKALAFRRGPLRAWVAEPPQNHHLVEQQAFRPARWRSGKRWRTQYPRSRKPG